MNPNMFMAWIDILSLVFVALGALNWGLVAWFKWNLVEWLASRTSNSVAVVLYSIIAISALLQILSRDYYLRFLGQAAFPCGALVERKPENATVQIPVRVTPNSNVIYWAAEPLDDKNAKDVSPWVAYQEYSNSGVVRSDRDGNAILHVRRPSSYTVPWKKTLEPHIHYRVCTSSGMAGHVETVFLPKQA